MIKFKSTKINDCNRDIVGIWKKRFASNMSSIKIARELRKRAWKRS